MESHLPDNSISVLSSLERYDTQTADERGGGGRALRGKAQRVRQDILLVAFITYAFPAELIMSSLFTRRVYHFCMPCRTDKV